MEKIKKEMFMAFSRAIILNFLETRMKVMKNFIQNSLFLA
jgi:hypothetical protein